MGSLLDDAAVLHGNDDVGVADGGEAMGDDECGAVGHEPGERPADRHLVDGIEMARRLVEDEDRRVLEEGAGNGDTLALAAGKASATLSKTGVETVSQACHDILEGGVGDGLVEVIVAGIRAGDQDIGLQRVVEEEGVLGDQGCAGPQVIEPVVPDVVAVEGDAAFVAVPEPHQEMGHGRLAGAAGADEGRRGARRN